MTSCNASRRAAPAVCDAHGDRLVIVAGQSLMLDNLAPRVVSAAANPDYRAYYSINETGWWLHLPNPLTPQTLSRQVASR